MHLTNAQCLSFLDKNENSTNLFLLIETCFRFIQIALTVYCVMVSTCFSMPSGS